MPPDTYSDLFFAYAVIWGCLFVAVCTVMRRSWNLERRLQSLEKAASRREEHSHEQR